MLTTYFLKCIAEDIFKHQEMSTVPYDFYIALSSTAPDVDGGGVTEPASDTGYARVQIENSNEIFGEADDDITVENHSKVYFPESVKSWQGLTHYAIFDDETDGNLLIFGELDKTLNVPIKTMVSIPIGTLKITAENGADS